MAFVHRAARDTGLAVRTAAESLGPGAYDPKQFERPAVSGAAFASSAPRLLSHRSDEDTGPGPGAYSVSAGSQSARRAKAPTLKSSAPRFTSQKRSEDPGPGAYYKPESWVRRQHSAPTHRTVHSERAALKRSASNAPTIPGRDAGGYMIDDHGTLQAVVKKPRPPLRRTLPGAFDEKKKGGFVKRTQPRFFRIDTGPIPGPGSYSFQGAAKVQKLRDQTVFGQQRGSAAFESMSGRTDIAEFGDGGRIGPGPGVYDIGFVTKPTGRNASFGTTSRRFPRLRSEGPGPARRLQPSFQPSKKPQGRGASKTIPVPSRKRDKETPAFTSSSRRFKETQQMAPGPGHYGIPEPPPQKVFAHPNRLGGFGSRSSFKPGDTPGPGSYAVDSKAPVTIFRELQPSHAFTSKEERFKRKTEAFPGPGTYDHPGKVLAPHSRRVHVPFSSQSSRFDGQRKFDPKPGPGAYDPKPPTESPSHIHSTNRLAGTAKRFRVPKKPAPGPGSYQVASDFVKKSFNVTIDPLY